MIVSPAVKPAGSFVLPEDTERFDDVVSVTKPATGLMFDTEFSKEWGYRSITMLTKEGNIAVDGTTVASLEEVSRIYSPFAQHIHVHRPPTDGATEFHHNEVMPAHDGNPWLQHQWYRDNFMRWVELLPRPSETVPGAVAYFQNLDKRVRNIRTPIKPGRFLQKFFGDILTQEQIHEHALEWAGRFEHPDVTITQDADEIEKVYRARHLGSCMHFPNGGWEGSCHPARVYAGPDLGIAYLGSTEYPDARVLVWPARLLFFDKFYGDDRRLRSALVSMGYRAGWAENFGGARIRRIRYQGNYVVPYVDCADWAEDDGEYLILGDGDISLDRTNGLNVETEPDYTCDHCGDGMDDDERNYVSSVGVDVCDHCLERKYFFCEGTSEYHENDELAPTRGGDGSYSLSHVKDNSSWFMCEGTDVYYHVAQYTSVETYEGDTYEESYAEENFFYCDHLEEWVEDTDHRVDLKNGKSVYAKGFRNEDDFQEYLADNETEVRDPPNPNQLELPIQEAA